MHFFSFIDLLKQTRKTDSNNPDIIPLEKAIEALKSVMTLVDGVIIEIVDFFYLGKFQLKSGHSYLKFLMLHFSRLNMYCF